MAKQVLPTNFKDDVLASSMGGKRRYILTENGDGTFSLEDATTYTQVGDVFGQARLNAICKAVNESVDQAKVVDDIDDIKAITQSGYVPGTLPLAQVINSLGGFTPVVDPETGKITGYKTAIGGADTVFPFNPAPRLLPISLRGNGIDGGNISFSLSDVEKILVCANEYNGSIQLSIDNPPSSDSLTLITLTDSQKSGVLRFSQNVGNANMYKLVLLFCKPGGTINVSIAMSGVDSATLQINNSDVLSISNTTVTTEALQILSKQSGNVSWNYDATITLKND